MRSTKQWAQEERTQDAVSKNWLNFLLQLQKLRKQKKAAEKDTSLINFMKLESEGRKREKGQV